MKTEKWTSKEGKSGVTYTPEAGDEVIAKYTEVGTRQQAINKDGKAIIIEKHFLGVEYKDDEITIAITSGQKKQLDKFKPLSDKTIVFEEYENVYGKQVGARVKK